MSSVLYKRQSLLCDALSSFFRLQYVWVDLSRPREYVASQLSYYSITITPIFSSFANLSQLHICNYVEFKKNIRKYRYFLLYSTKNLFLRLLSPYSNEISRSFRICRQTKDKRSSSVLVKATALGVRQGRQKGNHCGYRPGKIWRK